MHLKEIFELRLNFLFLIFFCIFMLYTLTTIIPTSLFMY